MHSTGKTRVGISVIVAAALAIAVVECARAAPLAPASGERNDDWIVIGPGGGGGQFIPTVSPHDVDTALVRCDMTGTFITRNGGESWRMFNLRGTTDIFVFDPVKPNVIYAKNVGLYRSEDTGETWELVYPNPKDFEKFVVAGDHGEVGIVLKGKTPVAKPKGRRVVGPAAFGSDEPLTALAVDPQDSEMLYAAMGRPEDSGLFVSKDYGETWQRAGGLPSPGRKIFVDPESPKDSRTVYVICTNRVSVLEGGEMENREAPPGVSWFSDVSGGFLPKDGGLVLYGVSMSWRRGRGATGAIYVSNDGGKTWNDVSAGMASGDARPGFRSVGACAYNGAVAYLSYMNLPGKDGERYFGVAKTADAGKTWELVWKESETIGENMEPGWMSLRFGPSWGENPISIGVAPTNPDVVFTTDYGRTLKTSNGGKTWQVVYSKKMENGLWTTRGLDVTTCYGVHFDPFDDDSVFISYTDIGLFRSPDGGATWQSATVDGVPDGWVNTTYWLEFDPEVKGRAWAVMAGAHDIPRTKMWRGRGGMRQRGGVCVSQDGGETWSVSNEGMGQATVTHILLDPASPTKARILYVAGFGTGVWKSTDGGKTWALRNEGIEGGDPFAWRFARDSNGVLYLIVARRSEDGSYNNAGDGALYRSTDGAETWEKMSLPEGLNGPNGLAIDPDDPKRLYLAVWGRYEPDGAKTGGIWLSTDAGATWKNVLSEDQYIYDVTIDPRDPSVLYACGFTSSAWRSEDRGETWKRVKGYNFKWGHRVICDPGDPDMIYVTTFGGSVWYGPAKGDPDAAEDIVAPAASY
ncbi:MAG: WD40/YVTN/BNR-like repeat-containing protein [Planctomycetota bacterium]